MSKKIILTGGGTAGHVTPNIALIPHLKFILAPTMELKRN